MGWKYFGDKTWAEVTRDERFFCQHLYNLIRHDVPGFVQKLNEIAGLNLPVKEEWEVGFEVCLYRDHRFMCDEHGHVWHGNVNMYSPKRTFDLCLFSHNHIVIIEAKAQQGFDPKQMGEFKKDREWVKTAIAVVKSGDGAGSDVEVDVVALASSKYLDELDWGKFNDKKVFSGESAVSWKALAKHYRRNNKEGDPVLLRADAIYDDVGPGGKNNDQGYKTGKALVAENQQGKIRFVGRNGGVKGKLFKGDIETGQWETQKYETSSAETKPIQNWFTLQEFISAIRSASNNNGEAKWQISKMV